MKNKKSMDLFATLSTTEKKQGKLRGMISAAVINKRHSKNLSQKELAKMLGITQGMVSKIESTEYNMTIEKLVELLESLNIDYNIDIDGKHCINNRQPMHERMRINTTPFNINKNSYKINQNYDTELNCA